MKNERDFLVQTLKQSGVHGKIHESIKNLKNCNEVHVGAVLRIGEKFTRSGSKKRYTDKQGQRKQRNKIFDRITTLHVVIADTSEDKVEEILSEFLKKISKGLEVDGNWVDIEITEADWVEGEDSILKSKIAVEFDVILTGGIYTDKDIVTTSIGSIKTHVNINGGD
ncbi:MAG: SON protein [Lachnospiraceae bacterium]|nr:SON protein [Lachnospiraceae bacterium]MDE6251157.1 SON protein [Lachnospiraceae bacterium]